MKTELSYHYRTERVERNNNVLKVGEGKVVHTTVQFDPKRNREFIYEITDTAMLIVRACDRPELVITKMVARPSRIKRYWADAPKALIELAVAHTRAGLWV